MQTGSFWLKWSVMGLVLVYYNDNEHILPEFYVTLGYLLSFNSFCIFMHDKMVMFHT